jgi:hypothetical protein
MLTDSPTGIVNVQPILEAIWLFLLGSCRRLANAAHSPSISSGFNPDIGSADICPRCPVPSVSRALALPIPNAGFLFQNAQFRSNWEEKLAYMKKNL